MWKQTWVPLALPGVWPICGGSWVAGQPPSAHPALSPPLPAVDAQLTPCKTTETDCELSYLEGRSGCVVRADEDGGAETACPKVRRRGEWGWGVSLRLAADQSFSTTSAEGLGMYKFILLFLNFWPCGIQDLP